MRPAGALRMAIAAGAITTLGACAGAPPSPVEIGHPTRSLGDAVRAARARSDSIRTVRGGLEIVWEDPGTGEPEGCSASLTYERPGRLRLRARTAAFFTVFDLVMGPEQVWLDVPRERITVQGLPGDPSWDELPVAPGPLLVALLADPWAGGDVVPEPRLEREGEQATLVGPDWTLRMDPRTGLPATYRRGEISIRWGDWALRKGVPWPHDVQVRTSAGRLRVHLGLLQIDRNLPESTFDFAPEPDREVLTPEEAKSRWESRKRSG